MGEPQRAQCMRFTPGEDAKTVGVPFVNRNVSAFTHTNVATGDDVCRRQLSQWQCSTFTGAPLYSYWISPQRHLPIITWFKLSSFEAHIDEIDVCSTELDGMRIIRAGNLTYRLQDTRQQALGTLVIAWLSIARTGQGAPRLAGVIKAPLPALGSLLFPSQVARHHFLWGDKAPKGLPRSWSAGLRPQLRIRINAGSWHLLAKLRARLLRRNRAGPSVSCTESGEHPRRQELGLEACP